MAGRLRLRDVTGMCYCSSTKLLFPNALQHNTGVLSHITLLVISFFHKFLKFEKMLMICYQFSLTALRSG